MGHIIVFKTLIFLSFLEVAGLKIPDSSTVPILWPLKPGTDWISCHPLQKALYLYKRFDRASWLKCVRNCQTDNPSWSYIGGIDNNWKAEIPNGSEGYNILQGGFLELTNVTEADNGTEFRCSVVSSTYRESFHILVLVHHEKGTFPSATITPVTTTEDATGASRTKITPVRTTEDATGFSCPWVTPGWLIAVLIMFGVLTVLVMIYAGYLIWVKCQNRERRSPTEAR